MPSMKEMWPLDTDEPEDKISEDDALIAEYKQKMAEAAEMYKNFK